MKIYIASSWKNRAAVEMLTSLLREFGHHVASFIENENKEKVETAGSFEEWVETEDARRCFVFDSESAMNSDLVVYIAPSGKDAACEVGMAFGAGVPVVGLWAKGEDFGLMRRAVNTWFHGFGDLLTFIGEHEKALRTAKREAQARTA